MAQRKAKTAKRPAKRPSRTTKAPSEAKLKLETRIKFLEKERERLKARLEVAGERTASLEQGRDDVVNRIDWVIDSLHNAIESEA
jgi:predicted RNase H-like nuclease (RuvC/YqgF family)